MFPGREGGEKQPGNEAMPGKAHSSRGLKLSTVDGKTLLRELLVGSQELGKRGGSDWNSTLRPDCSLIPSPRLRKLNVILCHSL